MTEHRHDFAPGIGHNQQPCRLCATGDDAGVIEYLAEQLWQKRRHGTLDDWPWAEAGTHWQSVFLDFAEEAVWVLRDVKAPGL